MLTMEPPLKTLVRFSLFAVLAFAKASGASGQTPAPTTSQTVFASGVEVVTVDVVVLDRQGNPVKGLTQADFTVKESGQPQTTVAFQAVSLDESKPAPRAPQRISTNTEPLDSDGSWFFVVFDDVNISQYSTPRARDTIVQFVNRALRPGDRVMLAPTSGRAWWTGRFPEDKASLVAYTEVLQGLRRPDTTAARLWDFEAMAIARGRDRQIMGQVARRYFEMNVIPEAYPVDRDISRDLDVSPGLALIQAKAREVYAEATERLRSSLGTLNRISAAVTRMPGRKTLLLLSEGFIMDPSQSEFRTLVQSARGANAVVHFVDVRSPEGMVGQAGMAGGGAEFFAAVEERDTTTALALATREGDGARSVAADTGGTIVAGTKTVDTLVEIAAESRVYYLLGYKSTDTKRDGKFRKIEVTVNRRDVTVRARPGYYAPSDAEMRPPSADKLDPLVRAALDAPVGTPGIPLRLTSFVFGQQGEGKMQVVLLAEADITPLKLEPDADTYSAALDSYIVVHGRDGGDIQSQETLLELKMPPPVFEHMRRSGVPVSREFSLAPGRYQARLLLRDRASGLLGSVRHEFEVPKAGQFRLSSPVLTDTFQEAAAGQPAARPVPIARRSFRAGSRLVCAFDVYGAALDPVRDGPRVSVGYRLHRAGTEIAASPPRPIAPGTLGRVSAAIALTLPPEAAGEYELLLTVRDEVSTRTLEISEPLVVEPR